MKLHLYAGLGAACLGLSLSAGVPAQEPERRASREPTPRGVEQPRSAGRAPAPRELSDGPPKGTEGYEVKVIYPSGGLVTVSEGTLYIRVEALGPTPPKSYPSAVTAEAHQGFPGGAGVPLLRVGDTRIYEGYISANCNTQAPYPSFSIATTADFVDVDEIVTGDDGGFEGLCNIVVEPPPDEEPFMAELRHADWRPADEDATKRLAKRARKEKKRRALEMQRAMGKHQPAGPQPAKKKAHAH